MLIPKAVERMLKTSPGAHLHRTTRGRKDLARRSIAIGETIMSFRMGTPSATSILSGGLAAGLSLLAGEYVLNVVVLGLDVQSAVADFTRLPPDAVIPSSR
jgi:hypothetical protein